MSAESRVNPKQLSELRTAAGSPFILLDESSGDAAETLEHYEAGASQVLPKPFVPDALIGAIKAELRGPDIGSVVSIATKIEMGGLVFDATHRTVKSAEVTVSVTKREWQLAVFLSVESEPALRRRGRRPASLGSGLLDRAIPDVRDSPAAKARAV